jgi:sec-independent protein translocase protein TatA
MGELFQPTHLLFIVIAALILFGPKKLPELGKGLGDGIRNFKDSMKQATAEAKSTETTPPATTSTTDHAA